MKYNETLHWYVCDECDRRVSQPVTRGAVLPYGWLHLELSRGTKGIFEEKLRGDFCGHTCMARWLRDGAGNPTEGEKPC